MSTLPTNAAASIAAAPVAAVPAAKRDRAAREEVKRPTRAADEVVVHTGSHDAARALASNDQEDAREDRQSHGQQGTAAAPPPSDTALDVRG